MIIKPNAIHPVLYNKIRQEITAKNFSWAFGETTDGDRDVYGYSFSNLIFSDDDREQVSFEPLSYFCLMAIAMFCYDIGFPLAKVIRIRAGLITATKHTHYHSPHVDYPEPHYTALLYFTNCNGRTQFYNEKYIEGVDPQLTIREEIIPEENKLVLFDGHTYHNSSTQTDTASRIAINFNLLQK